MFVILFHCSRSKGNKLKQIGSHGVADSNSRLTIMNTDEDDCVEHAEEPEDIIACRGGGKICNDDESEHAEEPEEIACKGGNGICNDDKSFLLSEATGYNLIELFLTVCFRLSA